MFMSHFLLLNAVDAISKGAVCAMQTIRENEGAMTHSSRNYVLSLLRLPNF